MTIEDAQKVCASGGWREAHSPVVNLEIEDDPEANIATAVLEDGTCISFAWRPHEKRFAATDGLFLC